MRHMVSMAGRSAWNRRLSLGMTMVAVALSVALLTGIERIREGARQGFSQSISGIDVVVGPRTSGIQVMLYAVFRLGEATSNMSWASYQAVSQHPAVAWTVPLSLGDSHNGFPVLGTTPSYFEHFRYGQSQPLVFAKGRRFEALFETVIGAEVASRLGYTEGQPIVVSHGLGDSGLADHGDKPFKVVGILERTGTPVDRTVHLSLESLEAIHLDWQGGAQIPGLAIPAEFVTKFDLAPKSITAMLVGLKGRAAVFAVQRYVNEYPQAPLIAVLPGVALDQLWESLDFAQRTLFAVSIMVVAVGFVGLIAVVLAGLGERRRELAILRSVGARPVDLLVLLMLEGAIVMLIGVVGGVVLVTVAAFLLAPLAQANFGIYLPVHWPRPAELKLLAAVLGAGVAASLLPGLRAYRLSLGDGLTPRV